MAVRLISTLSCSSFYRLSTLRRTQTTKNLATVNSDLVSCESRISFVTEDCTLEEMEVVQDLFSQNLVLHENFISLDEESKLVKEVEPYLKATKYQYDHWDDAIHGYRETEKSQWTDENLKLFKKMREIAFKPRTKILSYIHVLDLAKNGYIKPHIDSSKFCGSTIAGLSLLSSSVMRFVHDTNKTVKVDVLLNPRSLYIMRNAVRYEFTHEVLKEQESYWRGKKIPRDRRIALLMRCEPDRA